MSHPRSSVVRLVALGLALGLGCTPSSPRGKPGGGGGTPGGGAAGNGAAGTPGFGGSPGPATGGTGGPGAGGAAGAAGAGGMAGRTGGGGAGGGAGAPGTGGGPGTGGRGMGGNAGGGGPPDAPVTSGPEAGPAPPVDFPEVMSFDSDACHDLAIAVSHNMVGVATNPGEIFFYDKTGRFLRKANPYPGASMGDAHFKWDETTKRWFFSTMQGGAGYISVSRDEAGMSWTPPALVMTEPDMDNPNLTVTSDKVVLQNYGCVYTMDKDVVMAGTSRNLTPVRNCGLSRDDQIYGVDYGIPVPSTAYFVDLANGRRALNWISVEGTPKQGNVVVTPHMLPVRPITQLPVFPGLPQPGGTSLRNSGVCAEWHNDTLAWSKGVKCGDLGCARAFIVNTSTNTMKEYDFSMPNLNVWSAAPGIDRTGNVWFYMAVSSATQHLSLALAGVTVAGQVIAPRIVVPGRTPMDAPQFGDFFDGAQDPADGSVWFVGHYGAPKRSTFCVSRVLHVLTK
jgi:hypothetical protein